MSSLSYHLAEIERHTELAMALINKQENRKPRKPTAKQLMMDKIMINGSRQFKPKT